MLEVHEPDNGDDKQTEVSDDCRQALAASWPEGTGAGTICGVAVGRGGEMKMISFFAGGEARVPVFLPEGGRG